MCAGGRMQPENRFFTFCRRPQIRTCSEIAARNSHYSTIFCTSGLWLALLHSTGAGKQRGCSMSHTLVAAVACGVGVVVLVGVVKAFFRMLSFLAGCSATIVLMGVSAGVGYLSLRPYGSAMYVPLVIGIGISALVFRSIRLNLRG